MALIQSLMDGLNGGGRSRGSKSGSSETGNRVGYMKPIGQMWVNAGEEDGRSFKVDKDVVLARNHFMLNDSSYADMSPVIIERGKTKCFLDGNAHEFHDENMTRTIRESYDRLKRTYRGVVVERTGHCGVGSIIGWSNARCAAKLGVKVVLIANGGIGSTFDELALNRAVCNEANVEVAGVIVNRVARDKVDQTRVYLEKAMAHFQWDTPLLGVVPDGEMLDSPSAFNLATLFKAERDAFMDVHGESAHRPLDKFEVVTSSLERMTEKVYRNMMACAEEGKEYRTAFITHRSRTDIIQGLLAIASRHGDVAGEAVEGTFRGALVLTGDGRYDRMSSHLEPFLQESALPVVVSNLSTAKTVDTISSFTPKLNAKDTRRVSSVIDLYTPHIDTGPLLGEFPTGEYV